MLAYLLAWVVGLGSLGLYLAAFFFPEVHRKNDFIWSGVGLFYALVLWVYAKQMTGGILLGQTASVALLSWLGWETLKLRRQLTPSEQQTQLPDSGSARAKADPAKSSIQEKLTKQPERIMGLFTKVKNQAQGSLGALTSKKGKPGPSPTQPSSPSAVARAKETLEKDRREVAPPAQAVTGETVTEAAPIPEKIKPEVEVTPPSSSTDEAVDEWGQEPLTEATPTAKGVEPKTAEMKEIAAKETQVKLTSTKDSLQARFTDLRAKLTDLPIRDRWNKLSEQATDLFSNVKDRTQGLLGTVTQRGSKPSTEATQPPATPSTPADTTTDQDFDFEADQAEGEIETTAAAAAMDEVVAESIPVAEDAKPEAVDDEPIMRPTSEAPPEISVKPAQPEPTPAPEAPVAQAEPKQADNLTAGEETAEAAVPPAASELSAPAVEIEAPPPVEELAPEVESEDWPPPEVELAPEAESEDWPPDEEVEAEAKNKDASSTESSKDKEQKGNPSS